MILTRPKRFPWHWSTPDFEVIVTKSVEEALAGMETQGIDVVLADVLLETPDRDRLHSPIAYPLCLANSSRHGAFSG